MTTFLKQENGLVRIKWLLELQFSLTMNSKAQNMKLRYCVSHCSVPVNRHFPFHFVSVNQHSSFHFFSRCFASIKPIHSCLPSYLPLHLSFLPGKMSPHAVGERLPWAQDMCISPSCHILLSLCPAFPEMERYSCEAAHQVKKCIQMH